MAIWDSIKGNQKIENIEKLLNYFKKNKNIPNREDFIKILEQAHNPNVIKKRIPDDNLCEILEKIHFENKKPSEYNLQIAKQFYQLIVYDEENKEQIQLFNNFYDLFLESETLFKDFSTFSKIYNIFNNKKLVISIFRSLIENQIPNSSLNELFEYIFQARQYYVDESAYYSAVEQVIKKLESPIISDDIKNIIENALEKDRRVAGFYDIDETSIEHLNSKVEGIKKEIEILKNTKGQIEEYYSNVLKLMEETVPATFKEQIEDFSNLYVEALDTIKKILLVANGTKFNDPIEEQNLKK